MSQSGSGENFARRPHRTFAALSLPVMLSLIVEPLAGLVDTAFIERLGSGQAAALGAGTALLSSVVWLFNFLGIGTQTEVAHALGQRRPEDAGQVASLGLALALGLGCASALLCWSSLGPAAAWMSDDVAVQIATERYVEVRVIGFPAMLAIFTVFGALRGLQDMRTPLWIAAGMSLANVVLDAVLIFGLGPIPAFGIAGAAWATVASQVGGAAIAVAVIHRRLELTTRVDVARAQTFLVIGRDMLVRTGALLLFMVLLTRVALQMGAAAGAANTALRQIWMLLAFVLDAYAATAQSLVAYFLGSSRIEMARRVARVGIVWGIGSGVVVTALLFALEDAVAALLVPADAVKLFAVAWPVFAFAQPLNAISFVTDGIHWGAKDYRYLRNGMLVSGVVGIALLAAIDVEHASLDQLWAAAGVWIGLRALFGWVRVWPGIGRAPLGKSAAGSLTSEDRSSVY